jgi:Lon protease-like protein
VITHAETLADGRSNIVLRGIEKFRITGEDHSRPYRLAHVAALPEPVPEADRLALRQERQRIELLLRAAIERAGSETKLPDAVGDEDLVNALAQYLALEPMERQALLEREGIVARCRALIELLEIRTMTPRGVAWSRTSVH